MLLLPVFDHTHLKTEKPNKFPTQTSHPEKADTGRGVAFCLGSLVDAARQVPSLKVMHRQTRGGQALLMVHQLPSSSRHPKTGC